MSVQQDAYLIARGAGLTMMSACVASGISVSEARLIENAIARGEIKIPAAGDAAIIEGATEMARGQQDDQVEEVHEPDFERAVKIYRTDIKPANEKSGEHAQTASTGYKAIKKECHVNTRAAKFVFQLAGESEEKRNDVLRSLRGLLSAMEIGITDDLVSDAEGENTGASIVPNAQAEQRELVTVQ